MELHETLTNSPISLHFACAGAGVEFIRRLWATPGSSRYLAGTSLLQAREEVDAYIGYRPVGSYCSEQLVSDLAIAAFLRAARASSAPGDGREPVGIALSAAVASDRLPRGEQRAHLCLISGRACLRRHLQLEKALGEAARWRHDGMIAEALEDLVFEWFRCGMDGGGGSGVDLMARPCFLPDGRRVPAPCGGGLLFPANFNPVHEGHFQSCEAAERLLGARAELVLELHPPNKPAIGLGELLRRIARVQVEGAQRDRLGRAITVTRGQATFLDKARARPGSGFVVGADAVRRLLDPAWGYDVPTMLGELRALGTQFYVRARRIGAGSVGLDQIPIPPRFSGMFHRLEGYSELSSTQVRAREQGRAS